MKLHIYLAILILLASGAMAADSFDIKRVESGIGEQEIKQARIVKYDHISDELTAVSEFEGFDALPKQAESLPACIDGQAPTYNGCTVYSEVTFPPGEYVLNGTIELESNSVLDCSGSTLLKSDYYPYVIFENDTIVSSGDLIGVSAYHRRNISVRNCEFLEFSSGVFIYDTYGIMIEDNIFYNSTTAQLQVHFGPEGELIDNGLLNPENRWGTTLRNNFFSNSDPDYGDWCIGISNPLWFEEGYANLTVKILNNTCLNGSGIIWYNGQNNVDIAYNRIDAGYLRTTPPFTAGIAFYDANYNPKGELDNFNIYDNHISNFSGGIDVQFMKGEIDIRSNKIQDTLRGIFLENVSGAKVHSNTLAYSEMGAQFVDSVHSIDFFLNNIHSNYLVNMDTLSGSSGIIPTQLGFAQKGNYWGYSSTPCFRPSADLWGGTAAQVTDPYASCTPYPGYDTTLPLEYDFAWYFFSYNVDPVNSQPENVFQGSLSIIQVVKSFLNGLPLVWFFDDPFGSTLENMDYRHGYWFKTTGPGEAIVVSGDKADACNTLNLNQGIHWIGYYDSDSRPIQDALQSIDGKYEWVRTYDDNQPSTYNPSQPEFSDLFTMEPGKAYRIKMTQPGVLDYCT